MRSRSVEPPPAPPAASRLKKLGLACIFFLGGLAHELRNPLQCQCLQTRSSAVWRKPERNQR